MDFQQAEELFKQAVEAYENADIDTAIHLFSKIEKTSDALKAVYAQAQYNLGVSFTSLKRYQEAEEAYKNVKHEDSAENYATAQNNLGGLLDSLKRFDEAEEAYKNVKHEDSADQYASAQFNLGSLLKEQQRFEEAEQAYKNVKQKDSIENYATAQNNLGVLLKQQQRFEEAEQAYKNVTREDSAEQYAKAQFNQGNLLIEQPDRKNKAEECYKNVSSEDSKQAYAYAQWNLYWSFGKKKNYLSNIQEEHDLEIYAEARFLLGHLEENLGAKHEYWQQIPKVTEQYRKEIYQINVVKSITTLENATYKSELFQVFQKVAKVLEALFINNKYEQSIAHYTTLSVSKLLLSNKDEKTKDFEPKSKLRLNTINLMNDPEEGLLINKLLCLDSRINTQDSAFIACFTLHHDSLNQFRLYGKEDKEEASGLSLVLDKKFFASEHSTARIYEKDSVVGRQGDKDKTEQNSLAAMPLYRCIYFDPTSGLIKVAQREEWSFHREYKKENKDSILQSNPEAEQNWQEYQAEIQKIESEVRSYLEGLAKQVKLLNLEKLTEEEKDLLAEILLPLRYLMKHMAFKEEQECRIVYVTQMDNPLIQYHDKINRIYIDYEPSVMEHLEKIYLAPKAKGEKMVFEYLCSRGQAARKAKAPVQVKLSQNPFQ